MRQNEKIVDKADSTESTEINNPEIVHNTIDADWRRSEIEKSDFRAMYSVMVVAGWKLEY